MEKSAVCSWEGGLHWHPDLRLPDFRTMRNKFLLFVSHLVYSILLQQPELRQVDAYHM